MFGTYRFILAALVALSHFGVQAAGFNPGQWAVICFYMLSGLLMERQFQKLSKNGNGTSAFYLDRFLRIYPLFFVVLILASIGNPFSWRAAVANATLLPLNYSYFTKIPASIAVSWSLACEAHFYLLVPLLVSCSTKTLRVILCASLCFFAVSSCLPHSDFWAYVCLPGILFTFLSGILINRKDFAFIKILWFVMLLLLALFSLTKLLHTGLRTGIHVNVAIGYLVAVIATFSLDKLSPNVKWDKSLGLVSYPLFLCHEPAAAFLEHHWGIYNPLELLFLSILFSIILILAVETPFDRIRYRCRR
jgi:peptidoglycan/LPS O-acetylase OafA/YrhL